MRQWRVIYDSPTRGARNMAVDEAILAAVAAGNSPPTLRLYAWEPACLSLGYGQKVAKVDLDRLNARGWDLVRRPTGGYAILHTDELTYSVALRADDPLANGGIVASYHRLSAALLAALDSLGARVHAERKQERGGPVGPVCFEVPSDYEITTDGRKLVGSAQVRRKGGFLQHGSLPLSGDIARICDALVIENETIRNATKQAVRDRATTLAGAGVDVSWQTAADALARGFAETFDIDFTPGELTPDERAIADELVNERYGNAQHQAAR